MENHLRGRPDLQGRVSGLVSKLQPRIREVENEFSERYGWSPNAALNTVYNEESATEVNLSVVPGSGALTQPESPQIPFDFTAPTVGQIKNR